MPKDPDRGHRAGSPVTSDDGQEVARWLALAARGDQEAWRWIVDGYARRVYGLLRSRGCDGALAEEITQSVFVTVARHVGQGRYAEQGRFEAWLFRVATNRLRDEGRRRARRKLVALEQADGGPGLAERLATGPSGGARPGLDSHEAAETLEALRSAVAALSPADREVVELRHRAGMGFKQIAELLGQPLGTVLARHHRALRKIRAMLEPARDADPAGRDSTPAGRGPSENHIDASVSARNASQRPLER